LYRTDGTQSPPPELLAIPGQMQAVNDCYILLAGRPHMPKTWLARAVCFLQLNFPELAASDAYKAELLLDQARDTCSTTDMDEDRSKIGEVLSQALYDCHCHWEMVEYLEQASARFPSGFASKQVANFKSMLKRKTDAAAPLGGTSQEQKDRIRDGGVVTVDYPWLEARHFVRSQEVIDTINRELSSDPEQQKCYLAHRAHYPPRSICLECSQEKIYNKASSSSVIAPLPQLAATSAKITATIASRASPIKPCILRVAQYSTVHHNAMTLPSLPTTPPSAAKTLPGSKLQLPV
jgi:hypothetical protein